MKIGLVIAVVRELKSFLESDYKCDILHHLNYEVYHFNANGNDVYACKSGAGLIDASAATQMLISTYGCEAILNYGVTGAVDPSLKVEDLFIISDAFNHDFDTSAIDPLKKHQYSDMSDIYIPLSKELIDKALLIKPSLKLAKCASGDSFIVEKAKKEYLYSLGANVCDMELAGIARVCYLNGVKCLSVKCISDTYDGNGEEFQKNIINAGKIAFNLIRELLEKL